MNDSLDALLDAAAPELPDAGAPLSAELTEMIAAARTAAPAGRPVRHLPRVATAGIVVALVLGGAGAAAAATVRQWAPWAQHPAASYSFTLPSGKHCETRIGDFVDENPALLAAMHKFLDSTDVLSLADIDGQIAQARIFTPVGSENYDADREYAVAVNTATDTVLYDEMERQGFDLGGLWAQGQTDCE